MMSPESLVNGIANMMNGTSNTSLMNGKYNGTTTPPTIKFDPYTGKPLQGSGLDRGSAQGPGLTAMGPAVTHNGNNNNNGSGPEYSTTTTTTSADKTASGLSQGKRWDVAVLSSICRWRACICESVTGGGWGILHPLNISYQPILYTHFIHPIFSTHPFNPPYYLTLSTHHSTRLMGTSLYLSIGYCCRIRTQSPQPRQCVSVSFSFGIKGISRWQSNKQKHQ